MAKFKAYDYRQRVFLPVSLEDQLMPGTLEFATRLDTSGFEQKYRNDETGRRAYDPKLLLKLSWWAMPGGSSPPGRSSRLAGKTWSLLPWPARSSLTIARLSKKG